jgi:hypothetical protein
MAQVLESSEMQSAWKACLHMNTTASPHFERRGSMTGDKQLPQIVSLTTEVPLD